VDSRASLNLCSTEALEWQSRAHEREFSMLANNMLAKELHGRKHGRQLQKKSRTNEVIRGIKRELTKQRTRMHGEQAASTSRIPATEKKMRSPWLACTMRASASASTAN
jgi:hypothetical protein